MKRLVPSPQKLVSFLQAMLDEAYSGKFLRRVLEANFCRVNGRIERFGSTILQKGDLVELASSWKSIALSIPVEFQTLYENESIRLVNKPAGWVCDEENCRRTFGNGLRLVHRLDKDTTGVLALAKEAKVREECISLFSKKAVEKHYLAIVDGVPKENEGVRESYLAKKKTFEGQTIWGSAPKGLFSVTHWSVLSRGKDAALLLCRPITGRTHQIRVHLAEIGHPILIDRQYAARFRCALFASRPLLHALRLRLCDVEAKAPLPLDMHQALSILKIQNMEIA